MARTFLAAALLGALAVPGDSSGPLQPGAQVAVAAAEPDPARARPLGRWPDAADLARLRSVEGKPKAVILRLLGHPSRVERRPGGAEVWDYPWCAACRVWVRNGACTGTFYTAGY
jgi:hypothetical protein